MNTPTAFTFETTHTIRTHVEGAEVWFVAKDVFEALELSWIGKASLKQIPEDWKGVKSFITPSETRSGRGGGDQDLIVINFKAVCKIAFRSNKPSADHFTNWAAEVIDTVCRTGKYEARPEPVAPELVSIADMQNLSRLVHLMTHHFRRQESWSAAIWKCFRAVTGTPSPARFEVRHIPVLASECRRLYALTGALRDLVTQAEFAVMRRVLRNGEDAEKVLAEMRCLLAQAEADDLQQANQALTKWGEQEIRHFVERKQPMGGDFPKGREPQTQLALS